MPIKCYNKPNRSKPRHYSSCDTGRIARTVRDQGTATENEIMQCVALALGLEFTINKKPGRLKNLRQELTDYLKKKATTPSEVFVAIPGFVRPEAVPLVEGGLEGLFRSFLFRLASLPGLVFVGVVLLLVKAVVEFLDLIPALQGDYDIVRVKKKGRKDDDGCSCDFK